MTLGLRCAEPACRPHPASLPVRLSTVENLLRASFSFASRLRLAFRYGCRHRLRLAPFIQLDSAHAGHTPRGTLVPPCPPFEYAPISLRRKAFEALATRCLKIEIRKSCAPRPQCLWVTHFHPQGWPSGPKRVFISRQRRVTSIQPCRILRFLIRCRRRVRFYKRLAVNPVAGWLRSVILHQVLTNKAPPFGFVFSARRPIPLASLRNLTRPPVSFRKNRLFFS